MFYKSYLYSWLFSKVYKATFKGHMQYRHIGLRNNSLPFFISYYFLFTVDLLFSFSITVMERHVMKNRLLRYLLPLVFNRDEKDAKAAKATFCRERMLCQKERRDCGFGASKTVISTLHRLQHNMTTALNLINVL